MQVNRVSYPTYNTNFKAVNKKYLKEGIDRCIHRTGINETLFCLEIDVAFKSISPQDALDTLNAILPYAKEQHLRLFKKYEKSYKAFQKEFEKDKD